MRHFLHAVTCLAVVLLTASSLQAQQVTTKGKIVSAKDGTPLPGVTVQVAGTTQGVTRKFNAARDYWWPIPQTQRDLNPALEQNPNY